MTNCKDTSVSVSRFQIEDFLEFVWKNTTSALLHPLPFNRAEIKQSLAYGEIEFLCGRCIGLEVASKSAFNYRLSCSNTYTQSIDAETLQKLHREFRNRRRSRGNSV